MTLRAPKGSRICVKYALLGLASLGFGLVASCAADPIYDGETDLTITSKDPARNYDGYKTYRLAEDVAELCTQPGEASPDPEDGASIGGAGGSSSGCNGADHTLDPALIAALENEMKKFGYKRLDANDEDADLLLLAGWVLKPGWEVARAFCHPFTLQAGCIDPLSGEEITLVRRVSTPLPPMLVTLIDADESKDEDLVPIWIAAIDRQERSRPYGSTEMGGADAGSLEALIEDGIAAAFAQSTYLNQGAAK